MKEVWKDIKEYEGLYQVSNFGNIKSFSFVKNGKCLKSRHNKVTGYFYVGLKNVWGSKFVNFYVHRLVASAFLDNKNNYTQVNHINFDKSDNRVENLEWCTSSQNRNHSIINNRAGTRKCYEAGVKKTRERLEGWDYNFSKIVIDTNVGVFYRSSVEVQKLEKLKYNLRYYHNQGKFLHYQILD